MTRLLSVTILGCITFFVSPAFGQGDALSQVNERARATVQAHLNWTKDFTSTGASIHSKEVMRRPDAVQYEVFVAGLPTDTLYSAISWPINGNLSQVMQGISIGKDGVLMCAGEAPDQCTGPDPSKKNSPIDFTFYPQKGEPYRLAFISEDSKSKAAVVIIPAPIEADDRSCSLNVLRMSPKFELAYITGTGFSHNAEVKFEIQSWDEKHDVSRQSNPDGSLDLVMLTGVAV